MLYDACVHAYVWIRLLYLITILKKIIYNDHFFFFFFFLPISAFGIANGRVFEFWLLMIMDDFNNKK